MNRKLIALVPAAGIGARMGQALPKQYVTLGTQCMLRWSVQALLADDRIHCVRVAVAPDDPWVTDALHELPRTVWRPCGGATRALTVKAALHEARTALSLADDDWVLVHDAARPGLPTKALARLIDTCLQTGMGALLALPVADTVKRAQKHDAAPQERSATGDPDPLASRPQVDRSVSREGLWLAQTPQMFPVAVLERALAAVQSPDAALSPTAPLSITDEASAVERLGYRPLLVLGSQQNFKVTWPDDVALMTACLESCK